VGELIMDHRYEKHFTQKMKDGLPTIEIDGVAFPSTIQVCGTCRGRGMHVNPDIDSNGITASEMSELGEDFEESYFSGAYDVICNQCNGNKIIAVINHEACNIRQLALIEEEQNYIDEENYARSCRERGIEY
jgi:predicted methyltransferase